MTYNEFKNKYLHKVVDYDKQYSAQCWDLAQQYVTECLGLPEYILGGCGIVSNLLVEPKLSIMKEYFDVIPLDKKKTGDIEVFDYGHIAIMDHWDDANKVNYYLSQNTGSAEAPKGCTEVIPLYDNPQCMAFRKKVATKDLQFEIDTLKAENKNLKDKLNKIKNICN